MAELAGAPTREGPLVETPTLTEMGEAGFSFGIGAAEGYTFGLRAAGSAFLIGLGTDPMSSPNFPEVDQALVDAGTGLVKPESDTISFAFKLGGDGLGQVFDPESVSDFAFGVGKVIGASALLYSVAGGVRQKRPTGRVRTGPLRIGGGDSVPRGLGDASTSRALQDPRAGVRASIEEFRGGASYFLSRDKYDQFVAGSESLGRSDGLFVTTADAADRLIAKTSGEPSQIADALGLPAGTFTSGIVRIDVPSPLLHNARLPSGFEKGVNSLFRWGGTTSGGLPEIVLDRVPVASSEHYLLR